MTSSAIEQIVAQLREARAQFPELADVLDLHADLYEAGTLAAVGAATPGIGAEEAQARCAAGEPLLRSHELSPNWESLWQLYEQVCRIAGSRRPDLAAQFDDLLELAQRAPDQLRAALMRHLDTGLPDGGAVESARHAELLAFVFNHALRPFLRAAAGALMPLLEQELWQRGFCPICGGEPDFGILDEQSGARGLICSRCDTRWLYPRVKCPFCHTSNPADLAYYPWEDGRYRLYTCGACRRYLKTLDQRQVGVGMAAETARVLTVEMDVAAREEGYC
jgi:FdhE protein